jgi:magnesium-protoporphyrin O-methyltransferase
MPTCCGADAYAKLFDEKNAKTDARRYLKNGLDPTGRRMLQALVDKGVVGASVLEVGGGIGSMQIELLRAGAVWATNVEIVDTYEMEARRLLETVGLADRVDRKVLDFAESSADVAGADLVVLHRVICCYPDMESLVRAAATHASHLLALSFPPDRWWWRIGAGLATAWFRLRGCGFRIYAHDPRRILATAASAGFRPFLEHRGLTWQVAVLERSAS